MVSPALFIYNLFIALYGRGVYLFSFFDKKARLWVNGRKNQTPDLTRLNACKGKRIWIHCASLGEFEQARPLIEKVKTIWPESGIILSFFSPSGYEIRKNYPFADLVLYLPLDTKANAKQFLDLIRPDVALFVKYEFWYHHLTQIKQRKIPLILFSSVFRKEQAFFKWYGQLFRKMLKRFDKIFVQNEASAELLKSVGIEAEVAFDTRFDRVYQIAQGRKQFHVIEKFKGPSKVLIAGSTWPEDEKLFLKLINENALKGYKYIIAPHNLTKETMQEFCKSIRYSWQFFSDLNEEDINTADVLMVDTIGDLTSLYAYGDIAYVGGGFGVAVHNILEPAVFGLPVVFGPRHHKSVEANELTELGGAFEINSYKELLSILKRLTEVPDARAKAGKIASDYVHEHLGGTTLVLDFLEKQLKFSPVKN